MIKTTRPCMPPVFSTRREDIVSLLLLALLVLLHLLTPDPGAAARFEFVGSASLEGRFFPQSPLDTQQEGQNGSLTLRPEFYYEWDNGSSFTMTPFFRIDGSDSERSHVDLRQCDLLWLGPSWELRLGIGKVFWGATEFVHLVDIINQTDLVESLDGEDKLGQPMLQLSTTRDWGTVDFFLLPLFRERTFAGPRGRLRTIPVVDTDHARYESSASEHHLDWAVRYSHTIGNADFGIHHFSGTGREPSLLFTVNQSGMPILIPFYQQIDQTGMDLQMVAGQWLWKLEALHRTGQGEGFWSATGGFEYTFPAILDTSMDLGVITEGVYDDRQEQATTPFENDLMIGLRLAVNDQASTEILAGMTQDLDSRAKILSLEASRRLGDKIKIILETGLFMDLLQDVITASLRNDDFLKLELVLYF